MVTKYIVSGNKRKGAFFTTKFRNLSTKDKFYTNIVTTKILNEVNNEYCKNSLGIFR